MASRSGGREVAPPGPDPSDSRVRFSFAGIWRARGTTTRLPLFDARRSVAHGAGMKAPWVSAMIPFASIACGLACADGPVTPAPAGRVALALSPDIGGGPILGAVYDLRIDAIDDDGAAVPFLELHDLAAAAPGALTYVGTCRSGPKGEPGLGVATATLVSLTLADGESAATALPMTQVKPFLCRQGGDTPLDFDFEVVLDLDRGFTDITVDVEALSCACKLDCVDALLPTADGGRGPTLVTGMSCRGDGELRDDLLSFTRVVRCYDAAGAPVASALSTERSFSGLELDAAGGTAYWNTTSLFDAAAFAGASHCRFEALGVVRSQPRAGTREAAVRFGSAAIRWDIDLHLDDDGGLVCDGHVGPVAVPLRIDDRPTPSDATVSPRAAPVTWSTVAVIPDGDALRLWGADDVVFPDQAGASPRAPDVDRLLEVRVDGVAVAITSQGACSPREGRAWLVIALPGGELAALYLARADGGDWGCAAAPEGSCAVFPLDDVDCTPERR